MPQQLIYTSAPRGVVAGRSGHCTVARSTAMRDALMLQLEKFSYYQHLSLSGGQERPIYCCRVLDLRGSRYHILTRIQDAGLDFTGRTNFLAHHLIFTPEEVRQFASPPVILRAWSGWVNSWTKDPELFENEDWSSLAAIPRATAPALGWQQITGDAINGYGLLEARAGSAFRVDETTDETILTLFAESLELFELRDPRHDFRSSSWQYTFTTSMQEQDNPADFRWRCLHSDNPAANRFATSDSRSLSEVRASRVTNEEALFARSGRQPPRFTVPPQNVSVASGTNARLYAQAEGVPTPTYQWLTADRSGKTQIIANATTEELSVQNPPLGVTRFAVKASNSEGEITSDIVTLSVEQPGYSAGNRQQVATPTASNPPSAPHVKSASEIERQRQRLEADQAQEPKPVRKWPFIILGILFFGLLAGYIALPLLMHRMHGKPPPPTTVQRHDTNVEMSNLGNASNAELNNSSKETSFAQNDVHWKPKINESLSIPQTKPAWPTGWFQKAIGTISYSHADCVTNAPARFFLSTAGEGLRPTGDDLFFVCQTNNGSGFQASLYSVTEDFPLPVKSARGIMIRASASPTSSLLFIGVWSGGILACRRDPKGALTSTNAGLNQLPVILKFEQQVDKVAAAYSFDHHNWMFFDGYEFPLQTQSLAGFAAWSGDSSNRVMARFVLLPSSGSTVKN